MAEEIEVTEAKVTYTTKELLKRIDDRFERLEQIAQGAATRSDFEHLEKRVARIEEGHAIMKSIKAEKAAVFSRNDKILGGAVALSVLALNLWQIIHPI